MTYEEFRNRLLIAGIDVACKKMGYPFDEMFLAPCASGSVPYAAYYWCVYTTTVAGICPNIYIHAIPVIQAPAGLPWEEWFVQDGERQHHVCYTDKKPQTTNFVHIRPDDPDHPLYTLDKQWYWYNDPDLTPVLYR